MTFIRIIGIPLSTFRSKDSTLFIKFRESTILWWIVSNFREDLHFLLVFSELEFISCDSLLLVTDSLFFIGLIERLVDCVLVFYDSPVTAKTQPGEEIKIGRIWVFDLELFYELINVAFIDFTLQCKVITIKDFLDASVNNFIVLFFELVEILIEIFGDFNFLDVVIGSY